MGFYGNITNTSKTQFNFDRIYPNRKAMDDACKNGDGVAIGRFVLVEYGEADDYIKNYNIDIPEYGVGRGYDSTVWQKIYVEPLEDKDQFEKYVMIAELNSVVPTFEISVDAPTEVPLDPHFDKESTNVWYKMHMQPNWGMRVAAAADNNFSDEKNEKDENLNIYYNKEGFSVEKRNLDEITENKISITDNASGKLYNDCDDTGKILSENKVVKNDVKEISIMLPTLGNTISNIWDIVYGTERNLDIKWNSKKGLRLVDNNGYNKENVQTIAGCINSVHDLMGMIIEDEIPTNLEDYSDDVIYYKDNKYYKKIIEYDYENITDLNSLGYESIGQLKNYIPNTYFTKDTSGDYYLSTNEKANRNRNYYDIVLGNKLELAIYQPNNYYYEDNNNYILGIEDTVLANKKYYSLNEIEVKQGVLFYKPNTYFYKDNNNYVLDKNEEMTSGRIYYRITGGETETILIPVKDENDNIIGYDEQVVVTGGSVELVTLTAYVSNLYTKEDNNYIYFTGGSSIPTEPNDYYVLNIINAPMFYISGYFFYRDENGNLLKDSVNNIFVKDREYFDIDSENVSIIKKFYTANKYYYLLNDEYILETSDVAIENREYFEIQKVYVINDENGIYTRGMEWVMDVIPSGISVGVKTPKNELKELEGFSKDFNTIHGLILRLNDIIEGYEEDTRDLNTIKGCINKLNDIIVKFDKLIPGTMIIVDDYGRINPAELTSDNWLEWSLDTSVIAPKFNIEHKEAQDSIITIEPNNTTTNFGNNIKIDRIAIDTKGHVKELITEEISLPKLNLETNENSGVITEISIDEDTNALVTNYTPLSNVILEGYEKDNSIIGAIEATDTLKNGLSKIENNIQNIITDIDDRFNNWQKDLINLFVPIGFEIITADSNFDPAQHYPGTTWKRIMGKFIVGVDDSDSDFNEVDKTGGEKTVTLTVAQMPKHRHSMAITSMQLAAGDQYSRLGGQEYDNVQDEIIKNAGGNEPHNNLPPYITKYIWERIS